MRVKSSSVEPIQLGQGVLEDFDSFTYLGSIIDTEGGVTADIKARIGKARFWQAQASMESFKYHKEDKTEDFQLQCQNSVLFYGSETCCLTEVNGNRL